MTWRDESETSNRSEVLVSEYMNLPKVCGEPAVFKNIAYISRLLGTYIIAVK